MERAIIQAMRLRLSIKNTAIKAFVAIVNAVITRITWILCRIDPPDDMFYMIL
ncbi:hypothetical protein [Virgibacillus sp. Bac330]|uniref:hypothetical protein n=1 Tax=Virgibacillus sp. Bac330 TaxID=2419841 RepID=UPI0013CE8B5F|nr:hypothetical protein [Virgibacillus sp. Bac330]